MSVGRSWQWMRRGHWGTPCRRPCAVVGFPGPASPEPPASLPATAAGPAAAEAAAPRGGAGAGAGPGRGAHRPREPGGGTSRAGLPVRAAAAAMATVLLAALPRRGLPLLLRAGGRRGAPPGRYGPGLGTRERGLRVGSMWGMEGL